jgi:hypothetical protein
VSCPQVSVRQPRDARKALSDLDDLALRCPEGGPQTDPDVVAIIGVRKQRRVSNDGSAQPRAPRYSARLACGLTLAYESRNWLPKPDERVPCPRHGFCVVTAHGRLPVARKRGPVAPRRSQEEFIALLRKRPVISLATLRRERFTLRMVVAARDAGLVSVDTLTGEVALQTGDRP